MFIVDLNNDDIVWLAWAAGLAQGTGNEGAQKALGGILGRVQVYDMTEAAEAIYGEEAPEAEVVPIRPTTISEPSQPPPVNSQDSFGAGPPPANI